VRRARAPLLAFALALFMAGGARAQAPERFPPPPVVDIAPLLPKAPEMPATTTRDVVTTKDRAAALVAHPLHGQRFRVVSTHGDDEATRVVVVVPQYHRSTTLPLDWTSLGLAIVDVQAGVEVLTTVLAEEQGLACVGTEGSAAPSIKKPYELEHLAYRWDQLEKAEAEALLALDEKTRREVEARTATLHVVLENAVRDRMAILDGVGLAQVRLGRDLGRFGLEDQALNDRAVGIAKERDEKQRELSLLVPETTTETMDAVGEMWLSEYALYDESTLRPLGDALSDLDKERLALRVEGAEVQAELLGRYIAKARSLAGATIAPDDVEATDAYYRELKTRLARGIPAETGAPPPPLSAVDRARAAALEKEVSVLSARYREVTQREREAKAAEILSAHLEKAPALCAAVMGANHTEGLTARLLERATTTKRKIGVIVVEPWVD